MNHSQKKLLAMWFVLLVFIVFSIANHVWILNSWDWLKWPVLFVGITVSVWGGREAQGWGRPGVKLVDFVETYPGLKIWVVFYTLSILLFIAYSLNQGIEFHKSPGTWLLWGFVPLLLPLFAVSEYQRFKRLGHESDDME
ncbi:MAG: hypothetical protein ABW170_24220 [Candidatus Thiodiazotropha sp. L084R]